MIAHAFRSPLAVALLSGALALVDGFDSQVIAFAAPVMAPDFGTTAPQFGPVIGAGMIGSLIAVFAQAPLGDRLGRRSVVLLSLLVMGLATLATVAAGTLKQLIVLRFLAGLGIGAALPNLLTITGDHAPPKRRFLFVTAVFTGIPLGAVLGGSVAAWLLATQGWQSVFVLGGVAALAGLPAAFLWLPEALASRTPAAREAKPSVRQLFAEGRARGTFLLWTISFSSLLVSIFIVNWLPTILSEGGVTIAASVIGSVVLQGGGIVGSLTVSVLIDRRGLSPMIGAYLIGAASLAALAFVPLQGNAVLAVLFVAGLFYIGAQMCIASLSTFQYPPKLRAVGVGWAIGAGRIGGIVGTLVGGVLLARQVPASQLFSAAALIVVGVTLALGALAFRKRPSEQPPASIAIVAGDA